MAVYFASDNIPPVYDWDYREFEGDITHTRSPLLRNRNIGPSVDTVSLGFTWANCLIYCLLAMMLVFLYIIPYGIVGPSDPNPYQTQGSRHKDVVPISWFPSSIIRVNRALPDKVYASSPEVVLSESDSMFFQWQMPSSEATSCHIGITVPSPEERRVANQMYISSGPLHASEIEIWNVTSFEPMPSLSWNTRPRRISFMGTVEFPLGHTTIDQQEVEDGRQLFSSEPRFSCGENATYTIELACGACRIKFKQVPSSSTLAFNLIQFG
ncbi:hypothetical protein SERLA73DRAFT_183582 [Serpula lacrymans var. lacrymans S7.3]|uniref:Ubiquitin 3 binding protein But2 C-terminal domain-containing protein n=2 Tax=Serpula lacrymans var. lacrymans TaxID=341189 RepID=F8Q061_SERL3|nr:uncharacterized protein SERLADRAFT_470836 [Serpula lacrymans var. lacrymans S7.9]EGN98533.1 hypothetical protein SERLA73DRAFT_183582 [Serpula lacrymans var. lacrymans S7.3]EGO24103.1 hypothetical protein SERLADRAFT_470836 [Serpula lacrymans var. lacrymans S7.9]